MIRRGPTKRVFCRGWQPYPGEILLKSSGNLNLGPGAAFMGTGAGHCPVQAPLVAMNPRRRLRRSRINPVQPILRPRLFPPGSVFRWRPALIKGHWRFESVLSLTGSSQNKPRDWFSPSTMVCPDASRLRPDRIWRRRLPLVGDGFRTPGTPPAGPAGVFVGRSGRIPRSVKQLAYVVVFGQTSGVAWQPVLRRGQTCPVRLWSNDYFLCFVPSIFSVTIFSAPGAPEPRREMRRPAARVFFPRSAFFFSAAGFSRRPRGALFFAPGLCPARAPFPGGRPQCWGAPAPTRGPAVPISCRSVPAAPRPIPRPADLGHRREPRV
jgi:hypothetical protein